MRDTLYEGEWIAAFEKGISMIESCKMIRNSIRMEKIIINYFHNLVKMSPFDAHTTVKQLDVGLKRVDMWLTSNYKIELEGFGRYGRER